MPPLRIPRRDGIFYARLFLFLHADVHRLFCEQKKKFL